MSGSEDDGVGRRETAYRLFASEFEDADFSYAESDEERAPNYVVTPTGARINRLFVVGVLTEIQPVSDDVLRARVVDPTGAFVVYAGQYQPDAQAFLERADPPTFVAVSGKARTFQPDDSDVIYTSIRPESVNEVDADTRDRWTVQTTEQTLERIATMASALQSEARGDELRSALQADGVAESLAAGVPLAIDHYGTGGEYLQALRETALDAARVVADERDEVEPRSVTPDATGDVDLSTLTDRHLDTSGKTQAEPGAESPGGGVDEAIESTTAADSRAGSATGQDSGEAVESTASDSATDTTSESPSEPAEATAETGSSSDVEASSGSVESSSEPAETATESSDIESAETATESSDIESAETATESSDTESTETAAASPDTATESAETVTESATDSSTTAESDDDIGDFEPGEFDLDEETREEVESEYGTEFQSGAEVEEPGAADIDTPDPADTESPDAGTEGASSTDEADESGESTSAETVDSTDSGADTAPTATDEDSPDDAGESGDDAGESTEDAPADSDEADADAPSDVDLEDAVMDAMRDLDDGDGADREGVTAAVVDQYGADPDAVEDAIQDALMNGRCYEPDDETLTPI